MQFPCGISIYLSYQTEQIKQQIMKAHESGLVYVFTSLHIMEEEPDVEDKAKEIFSLCRSLQMETIVDVSPNALIKLHMSSFDALKDWGFTHLRLDFGFNYDEIKKLSEDFDLILNASCFSQEDYQQLKERNVDFSKIHCCHNFYPKKYSGLALEDVIAINRRLHSYGLSVMGFVMGDNELRGPLYDGLCTIEEQRNNDVLYNVLSLFKDADCDVVLCGDFGLKDETYQQLKMLNEATIELHCRLADDKYNFILEGLYHDRRDNSPYLIRCVESRRYHDRDIATEYITKRPVGAICLSNNDFLRYSGELEIMKKEAEADNRVNVIGVIEPNDLKLLRFINEQVGFQLKQIKA